MVIVAVVIAAIVLSGGVYWGLERLGSAALVPAALRAGAWLILGLLLLDLSCARPPEAGRPLVLLDASLSMAGAGGRWAEARAAANGAGEVRLVGTLGADSLPTGGRSILAGAVAAGAASGRPVWLVTDGELEDGSEIPADILAQTGIKLFARPRGPDLALVRVSGPERIAVGDTLRLDVEVSGFEVPDRTQVTLDVSSGDVRWLSATVPLTNGSGAVVIEGALPLTAVPGRHLLTLALRDARDGEPRTDRRLHAIVVLPTPGIVVVANPASWESRFFFRTIGEVAALPVRGYFAVAPNRWARMGDLTPVSAAEVDQAVARADLLVQFGDGPDRSRRSAARGRLDWVATSKTSLPAEGDWYLLPGGVSPVSGAFVGLPVDSFPPAAALVALTPGPGDWVGLVGQLSRRGGERPAVVGRDSAGRREVLVGAAGLWRWAFRGGQSEQAYRAWVAATTTWLLGASDSATGRARPVRAVVAQGRPVVFERLRPDVSTLRVDLRHPAGDRSDTLRFDGSGRAELFLAPGRYDYRLEGGGSGLVGVEVYSEEWLPRPVVVPEREATAAPPAGRAPLRDQLWLFALVIVTLSGEWWWRRRAGLR